MEHQPDERVAAMSTPSATGVMHTAEAKTAIPVQERSARTTDQESMDQTMSRSQPIEETPLGAPAPVVRSLPGRPPGIRTDEAGLTERQRRVIEVIRDSVQRRGYPPSMREIGQAVGLSSTSSVAHQLMALERKGFLRRDPHRPRAYEVRGSDQSPVQPTDTAGKPAASYVPLVGRIAAGGPILAEESVEDVFPLPRQLVGD